MIGISPAGAAPKVSAHAAVAAAGAQDTGAATVPLAVSGTASKPADASPGVPLDSRAPSAAECMPRFSTMMRHTAAQDEEAKPDIGDAAKPAPEGDTGDSARQGASVEATPAFAPWPGLVATVMPPAIDPAVAVAHAPGSAVALPVVATRDGRAPADPSTIARTGAGEPARVLADADAPARDVAAPAPRADVAAAASARPQAADAASPSPRTAVPAPVRERVAAATPTADATIGAPAWTAAADPVSGIRDAGLVTIKLPPQAPEQWRQPLAEALGDRLRLQVGHGSEEAVIRLDPPMLGRIEISIRHEAGSLQVQLSASNGEVLRQLHGIGDSLRQDLSQRQQGEVSVVVSDSSRDAGTGGEQRGRERDAKNAEDGPGRALADAETDGAQASFGLAREGSDAA